MWGLQKEAASERNEMAKEGSCIVDAEGFWGFGRRESGADEGIAGDQIGQAIGRLVYRTREHRSGKCSHYS